MKVSKMPLKRKDQAYIWKRGVGSIKRLLQGLLMNSGNDAGTAIAEHLSGSVKQFADDLNAFIAEHAGVHDTHL
ncbi:hypothetical protein PO124_07620 [Bacillus licheniformis]|nr:hypothetical protein [Bacillus licheniformis]